MTQDTPTLPPKADATPPVEEAPRAPVLADKLARFMERMDQELAR